MPQKWVKHTINLVYGSDLDMKFKISPNKSHMVRHVFQRAAQLRLEVLDLSEEIQYLKEGIAKLQARLEDTPVTKHDIRQANEFTIIDSLKDAGTGNFSLPEGQTTFEVKEE